MMHWLNTSFKKRYKSGLLAFFAIAGFFGFQNCGGFQGANSAGYSASSVTQLSAVPQAQPYKFSKPLSPYHFVAQSGPCTIDPQSGLIEAESTAGVCVFTVTDSSGEIVTSSISVYSLNTGASLVWVQTNTNVPATLNLGISFLAHPCSSVAGFALGATCTAGGSFCATASGTDANGVTELNVFTCQPVLHMSKSQIQVIAVFLSGIPICSSDPTGISCLVAGQQCVTVDSTGAYTEYVCN
jgi:hypothetical protein